MTESDFLRVMAEVDEDRARAKYEAQSVILAVAATYSKHLTPDQRAEVGAKMKSLIAENGWKDWFEPPPAFTGRMSDDKP